MDQIKCDAIQEYLQEEFPDSPIDQANISDDQHYRIHIENGLLMLRVGRNFIDDNNIEVIIDRMRDWEVANLLRDHSDLGVLITDGGASAFTRN